MKPQANPTPGPASGKMLPVLFLALFTALSLGLIATTGDMWPGTGTVSGWAVLGAY